MLEPRMMGRKGSDGGGAVHGAVAGETRRPVTPDMEGQASCVVSFSLTLTLSVFILILVRFVFVAVFVFDFSVSFLLFDIIE